MRFTKMHGIGNDFVMVDCLGQDGARLADEAKARAVFLNDRRFGVGADGVILVERGHIAPFAMRMFNPDGSEAEMCGNGIRCFAKFVVDRNLTDGLTDVGVETGAGLLHVQAMPGADGMVEKVRVDMGCPVLTPALIPAGLRAGDMPLVDVPLALSDRDLRITCVSMGNPHAVVFVDRVADYPVAQVGPQVEKHPAFPRRTNTEFIEVLSLTEISFRVWERGAGGNAGLRHRGVRGGRGLRAERQDRARRPCASAGGRLADRVVGNGRSCLHDRSRHGSVLRRGVAVQVSSDGARPRRRSDGLPPMRFVHTRWNCA